MNSVRHVRWSTGSLFVVRTYSHQAKAKKHHSISLPLDVMGLWSGISVLRPHWNNRHRKLENFLSLELINTNSVAMAFNRSKGLFTHNVCVSVNIQLRCSAYSDTYTNVENG